MGYYEKRKNELLELLGGLAMLVVGLYLFMQKVTVSTYFFGGRGLFGVSWISSGLVVVPFIIDIIVMFVKPQSFMGKLITGLGLLVIVVSVIALTTIRLSRVTLYEWLLFLVLIFGGLGIVLRIF